MTINVKFIIYIYSRFYKSLVDGESLIRNVDTVQELSDILILDQTRLVDESASLGDIVQVNTSKSKGVYVIKDILLDMLLIKIYFVV